MYTNYIILGRSLVRYHHRLNNTINRQHLWNHLLLNILKYLSSNLVLSSFMLQSYCTYTKVCNLYLCFIQYVTTLFNPTPEIDLIINYKNAHL